MNKAMALVAAMAAFAALAQPKAPAPQDSIMVKKSCDECGVVRSVRKVESQQPLDSVDRGATAGLVATIPLGGGKPQVGSSTDLRKELKPATVTWEVVVRLDDGRFRVVLLDDPGSLREDDRVKVVDGRVELRDD